MSQMCHIHFRSCFTKKPNFSQGKICQNTCFLWPLLSDIRRENTGRRKPVIRHVFQNVSENQKQPSRGVLRRRCSANIYQIYRRAPMPKCIEITIRQWVFSCKICCLFSEYLFLRTPLEGCFWKTFLVTTWPWTGIILVLIIRQVLATGMSFLNLFSLIKLKTTRHAVTFQ